MSNGYLTRLLRSVTPYLLFYLLLALVGAQIRYGWIVPLPVLIIGLLKVMPGSRYELRSIELRGHQVAIRYADYFREHERIIALSQVSVTMKRDPSTIHKHFVLNIDGPNLRVRQYERGQWNVQKMEDVLHELLSAGASVRRAAE